jgi:hypothetical protein
VSSYKHKVGKQTYTAREVEPTGNQRWIEFQAPSQKAVKLDLVIDIARSLPAGVLFGAGRQGR